MGGDLTFHDRPGAPGSRFVLHLRSAEEPRLRGARSA
jgi:hypothetical protein